jgi:hypothetical protein
MFKKNMFCKEIKEALQVCHQESFKGALQVCPNKDNMLENISKEYLKGA